MGPRTRERKRALEARDEHGTGDNRRGGTMRWPNRPSWPLLVLRCVLVAVFVSAYGIAPVSGALALVGHEWSHRLRGESAAHTHSIPEAGETMHASCGGEGEAMHASHGCGGESTELVRVPGDGLGPIGKYPWARQGVLASETEDAAAPSPVEHGHSHGGWLAAFLHASNPGTDADAHDGVVAAWQWDHVPPPALELGVETCASRLLPDVWVVASHPSRPLVPPPRAHSDMTPLG